MILSLLAATVLSGCRTEGLAFVQDKRLTITHPEPFSTVTLPLTVEWTMEDYDGQFGVFLDRAAMPPGEDLEYLARDDEDCEPENGCPDTRWLRRNGVYVTTETSIDFRLIPDLRPTGAGQKDQHEVTIVLLDENGVRQGESAFGVDFFIDRPEDAS